MVTVDIMRGNKKIQKRLQTKTYSVKPTLMNKNTLIKDAKLSIYSENSVLLV